MSQRKLLYVVTLMLSTLLLADCAKHKYSTSSGAPIDPTCLHKEMPWSEYECYAISMGLFAVSDVDSMTLTIRLRDGRTLTRTIPPRTDAIFLSRAAIENFLLRHYDATDPARARELRERLERDRR